MFRELVRKKKQLSEAACEYVLKNERRGVLSVIGDNGYPYGTPMNHFYNEEDGNIYFHCGKIGHRLDALRANDKVCFTVYDSGKADKGEWALKVNSVIVFGKIEIIDDPALIADITARLSRKFIQDEAYIANEIKNFGHQTLLLKLVPEHICGKQVTES